MALRTRALRLSMSRSAASHSARQRSNAVLSSSRIQITSVRKPCRASERSEAIHMSARADFHRPPQHGQCRTFLDRQSTKHPQAHDLPGESAEVGPRDLEQGGRLGAVHAYL